MRLNIIGPDDPALDVLKTAIIKQPKLDINLTTIPWSNYRDTMLSTLKSKLAPNQAVFVPGHIWIPELAHAGYLAKLDPILKQVPSAIIQKYDADDIVPSISSECEYLGSQYQLPFFTDGHILFYRADIIKIDDNDKIPVISTQMIKELSLKANNPPHTYGLALKADISEIFTDFLPYLWEENGYIFDKNGIPNIANEFNIKALQNYCSLKQFCPPDTHTYGNAEIAKTIKDTKAALVANWGGQSAPIFLNEENTYIYKTATYKIPWNTTWGIAIPNNQPDSTKQQTLSKLMQLLDKEQDKQITVLAGSPVRKSSYSSEELGKYPWLSAQKEMLKRAKILPKNPKLGLFLGALYENIHKAFTNQMSPKEALESAQKEAMSYYDSIT